MEYFVYKITCNNSDIDHAYVGSSEDLEQRTRGHKDRSKNEKCTIELYKKIREHGGIDNWTMEVVESGTVETKFEIKSRERVWFDELQPNLNTYRPQSSSEEIRIDGLKKAKQYQLHNKDNIKQYQFQYKLHNKEKLKEYNRQYHLQNKDKIKQYDEQNKVRCDACNCEIQKSNMARHLKHNQHIKNLELNKQLIKK